MICSYSHPTALTVQNILQELRGVDLFKLDILGKNTLGIPSAKLDELMAAHHSTDQQEAAVVRYWLLRDPLASWRRIIHQLDRRADYFYTEDDWYSDNADRIRHYAEELTGMCCFIKPLIHYPCIARD